MHSASERVVVAQRRTNVPRSGTNDLVNIVLAPDVRQPELNKKYSIIKPTNCRHLYLSDFELSVGTYDEVKC